MGKMKATVGGRGRAGLVDVAWIALLALATAAAPASAATTLVGLNFENATVGDSTATASTVGPGISGVVFGGTKDDSEVFLHGDLIYRSSALFPNTTNGGFFPFFSFTTSVPYDLGSLSFAGEQNDVVQGTRDFKVLLSPVNHPAPATGDVADGLAGYSLLTTIAVPYGFALGSPNFAIDLTGTTLAPGTYHIAFAVAVPEQIGVGTTQLFIDDLVLSTEAPKQVFITSTSHQGDLGGLSGADAICNQRANGAELPGRYRAWLSDSFESPNTRFSSCADCPYVRTDGVPIAFGYGDLTDGSLLAPIDVDESGVQLTQLRFVWTSTHPDGELIDTPLLRNCSDWTSSVGEFLVGDAFVGFSTATDENWTRDPLGAGTTVCSSNIKLYCFEQGGDSKGVSTDPFDSTQGTVVTASDTATDAINAFRTSGGFEDGNVLMRNGGIGSVSFIEFQTTAPVTIRGVRLFAHNDSDECCLRRSIGGFKLLADTDPAAGFETVAIDVPIDPDYSAQAGNEALDPSNLELELATAGSVRARNWRIEVTQGTAVGEFEGARLVEVDAIPVADEDLDGVEDADDNCVDVENPNQQNADGDLFGDACDNCAADANDDQADADADLYGDVCDSNDAGANEELIVSQPAPVRPGEPLPVQAKFQNPNEFAIITVRPDCFNTGFEVRRCDSVDGCDGEGERLAPTSRLPAPYKLALTTEDPTGDLIILQPEEAFVVTCDLAELFPPEELASGDAGVEEMYEVKATYANDLRDPDCVDPAADPDECVENQPDEVVETFVGAVTSEMAEVVIAGEPILKEEQVDGTCSISPSLWYPQWIAVPGPTVSARIGRLVGAEVDLATLRMNGTLEPVSVNVSGADVVAMFERSAAIRSLGTLNPGTTVFPRVTGSFVEESAFKLFRAECSVEIEAAIGVEVDIKPGEDVNVIKLGSKGNIPVAILSSETFDASTVNPNSVALANAGLKIKGNGQGIYSLEDVNADGRVDLLVHILTQGLELTASAESAELVGTTRDGVPIFGVDTVQVKQ